jgi:hypothetical protein
MQKNTSSSQHKRRKSLFKKRNKRTTEKAKIEKFASSFYAQYGEMMSKLSHE